MKRVIVIIGVVLAAAAVGVLPAFAGADGQPSDTCSNGSWTEFTVTPYGSIVTVGGEYADPLAGGTSYTVCYSDRPTGSPTAIAGGYVNVAAGYGTSLGLTQAHVNCVNDNPTVPGCGVHAVVTTAENSPSPGKTVGGTVTVQGTTVTVGQTGIDVGSFSTVHDPGGPRNDIALNSSGTCVRADGAAVGGTCSTGGTQVAFAGVSNADAPRTTTQPGCAYVNTTCVPVPGAGVAVGSSTSDGYNTVGVAVLGTSHGVEVPYQCVENDTPWEHSTGCR